MANFAEIKTEVVVDTKKATQQVERFKGVASRAFKGTAIAAAAVAAGMVGIGKAISANIEQSKKLQRASFFGAQLKDAQRFQKRVGGILTEMQSLEEIAKFYEDNRDQYGPQPEVHARHILIRTDPAMDDMAKATARQKITDALARIKGGEDFAAVASEVSEDPTTSSTGGDLQWFGRGQMVASFDQAAFSLDPGQVSEVIETQYGYHVLKVDERLTMPWTS